MNAMPRFHFDRLAEVKVRDLWPRAAFGMGVSIVAGLCGLAFGARVGGMFLACPAILPATLTFVEKRSGGRSERDDEAGSIGGALGLVAFAVVALIAFRRAAPVVALIAATVAWFVVALGAYAIEAAIANRVRR